MIHGHDRVRFASQCQKDVNNWATTKVLIFHVNNKLSKVPVNPFNYTDPVSVDTCICLCLNKRFKHQEVDRNIEFIGNNMSRSFTEFRKMQCIKCLNVTVICTKLCFFRRSMFSWSPFKTNHRKIWTNTILFDLLNIPHTLCKTILSDSLTPPQVIC